MCGSRLFLRGEGLKSKPLKQTIETLTMDFSEGWGWGLKQKFSMRGVWISSRQTQCSTVET